jgi:hypothetical protein
MMEVEGDVRPGDHAFTEHDEDDAPNRLEQEKNFGAPNYLDTHVTEAFPQGGDLRRSQFLREKNEVVVVGPGRCFCRVRAGENCNALNFAGFVAE